MSVCRCKRYMVRKWVGWAPIPYADLAQTCAAPANAFLAKRVFWAGGLSIDRGLRRLRGARKGSWVAG